MPVGFFNGLHIENIMKLRNYALNIIGAEPADLHSPNEIAPTSVIAPLLRNQRCQLFIHNKAPFINRVSEPHREFRTVVRQTDTARRSFFVTQQIPRTGGGLSVP